MQNTIEEHPSWLNRPLLSKVTINLEIILFTAILILAVFSRLNILGARVMSHDENSHVYFSWLMYQGKGYQHDPITHGPLQFHLIALSYFLFGDNDTTARLPAALFGIASVAFIWNYRRYLGKTGAIVGALLFVISPYMLYYSRYARNESFVAFFGLLTLWSILRYIETGKPLYLFYFTAATVFHFTAKETSYIYTAQALLFLAMYFVYRVHKRPWPNTTYRKPFFILFYIGILAITAAMILIIVGKKAAPPAAETLAPAIPGAEAAAGVTQLITPIGIIAIVLAGLALLAAGYFLVKGYTWKLIRAERSFDLLILLGTLVLPLLSAFPLNAIGLAVPTNATGVRNLINPEIAGLGAYTNLIGMIAGVVLMFLIAIAVGLWWNWRLWLANFALFYTVFIVFYTTFFTNGAGFATGLVGSLGYWLAQQEVNRGSQPWYYYAFVQIPIYEYLPALGCILAVAIGLFRKQPKSNEIQPDSLQGDAPEADNETAPALALFGFWTISSLVAYTIAGEKMPWLTVHITLPMLLLTAWAIGYLIDTTDWKAVRTGRGFLILAVLVVFLSSLAGLLGSLLGSNPPFQGKELVQLQSTSTFLLSFVAMIASGWGLIYLLRGWETPQIVRLFTLAMAGVLTLLTARTAFMASFVNYDYAKEFLVYAHAGPGIKTALSQIEEISRRTTDGLALAVGYDDKTTYPYWWYLRNYPAQQFFGDNPTRNLREVPAILVGDANYSKIEPVVGEAYYPYEYVRMWWPTQDYFGLTWKRIFGALINRDMREALFRIWLNRDFSKYATLKEKDMSLPNWDPGERFRLYLRKDVAATMWNYGTSPAPAEIVADPYENKGLVLEADIVLGQAGTEPGQFNNPHNVAVAPDGTLYVLDSGNARVQHLSRLGEVLQVWGSFADMSQGNAPGGTFSDPWSIAVGPDGSVYVADTWNHRIQKFTPEGEFIKMWGYGISQSDDPFGFYGPRGIAVDADGYVYVADTGNDRLVIFDSDGEFINQFGGEGFAPGQFDEPTGVAVNEDGWLFVTDTWNQRIQSFLPEGEGQFTPDRSWDISGWYGRSLKNYPYLAVDQDGNLYTTDPEGVRVLAFTTQGDFQYYWGEYGSGYDQFLLPQGIAVDPEGGVWVVDTENSRVMHFKLPTNTGSSEDTEIMP